MGYQMKSYKKFIATAATATLVASAIMPVAAASFSDVEETHEFATYINAAVDAGYIKGYADGTFGINDNLKRSQVVIIIGRYLESLGYTSEKTTSPWSDVKGEEVIKYGNIVKDAGVFTGYADGTLKGAGSFTRENMAVVLDRLAKSVTGTSLSDVAAEIEDVKVADLAKANANYRDAIQALRDLGISTTENFNPKGNVKRGQFAKFIMTAVEKIDEIGQETPEAPEVVVESVNTINDITVVEGMDVLAQLPTTVEATVVDSTEKVTLDINWTAPEGFEGKDGEYTFTGTVSSADEKVIISEDKATVTVKVTIDKTAPMIESVKVNDATAIYDEGVITLEQGSAVDTIEITMSEAVVLPADLNVLFDTVDFESNSGAPTDFEGRVYGTAALKEGDNKTIIIKPSENNGVAAYVGTITFKLSDTVTDLVGNAFAGAIPTLNVTSDNLVQNAQDAQKAVAKGGVTLFVSDIAVQEAELVTGYGSNKTGIAQNNLGVINGNGKTLSVVGANRTWDSAIYTKGGTIKNLTIDSGFRGILIEATKGDVVVDNVTIDGPVYTINSDNGGNNKLIVSNSTLKGWTSYAATHSQASFTNCKFGEGSGYAFLRPYAPSTFVNCEFETGFKLDATKTSDIVLENCTVNGVALTAENLTTLLGDSAANAVVK